MKRTIKRCSCCGRSFSAAEWLALRFIGVQRIGDGEPDLALRNCGCGTTLAITVAEENAPCR